MSAKEGTSNNIIMSCCASCGAAEGDGIQLRTCTACKSVRYCGVTCQRNHRPKHKKACKKRAAELRDEILFRQPESTHLGDCPICLSPLPLDQDKRTFNSCCSKVVCKGCVFAYTKTLIEEQLGNTTCPFCRADFLISDDEQDQKMMKRVQANDPNALRHTGLMRHHEGNYAEAFQYYSKAAELGDAEAHHFLSATYHYGRGVEKDEKKEVYHLEEAAIGGHPDARYQLGINEGKEGRIDRSVKHLIIAANLGHDLSLQSLKVAYKDELVSKEDFASVLRAHKAAVDAMKSPQRDEAAEVFEAIARMK